MIDVKFAQHELSLVHSDICHVFHRQQGCLTVRLCSTDKRGYHHNFWWYVSTSDPSEEKRHVTKVKFKLMHVLLHTLVTLYTGLPTLPQAEEKTHKSRAT